MLYFCIYFSLAPFTIQNRLKGTLLNLNLNTVVNSQTQSIIVIENNTFLGISSLELRKIYFHMWVTLFRLHKFIQEVLFVLLIYIFLARIAPPEPVLYALCGLLPSIKINLPHLRRLVGFCIFYASCSLLLLPKNILLLILLIF